MTTLGKLVFGGLILIVAALGAYYWKGVKQDIAEPKAEAVSFYINGEPISLVNGTYEKEVVPGSAAKTITRYFGNEVEADLNGDGKEDKVFLVTQNSGGSGTFFYVATSLGGEAILLGDRIAPQTSEWRGGNVIINYADRKPNEPMTAQPSVGVSRYFKVENGTLVEIKKETPSPVATTTPKDKTTGKAGEKCAAKGGTWSSQYKECTGVNEASCTAIGGTWNDCASPCRNDPGAQACIMMCVQVCTIK